jgi:hypothetical protein
MRTQIRVILVIVAAIIAILRMFSSCSKFDSGAYAERGLSIQAKFEFEKYLNDDGSGTSPLIDLGDGSVMYSIQWTDNGRTWRDDLRGAWCVNIIGGEIRLKHGVSTSKFVVYQTIKEEWGVTPSFNIYTQVGCKSEYG